MARALTATDRSTPTFLFSITDADSSGVDFAGMNAMMCLRFTNTKTDSDDIVEYRYVVPNIDTGSLFPKVSSALFWMDDMYSRLFSGNSTFAVTVPLWKYLVPDGYTLSTLEYQVFLFSNVMVSGTSSGVKGDGTIDTNPGKIAHHNILIDDGTIELTESFFPYMYSTEMAQNAANLADYLTPSQISAIGAIDTSAWDGDDSTLLSDTISKELVVILLLLVPKYDLDNPPLTGTDLGKYTLDEAYAVFADDIKIASAYAPYRAKPSVS